MQYHQLSLEEREKLFALREQGISFRATAKVLGRSHTTLLREYRRHAKYGVQYIPCKAHENAQKNAIAQRSKSPLKNPFIFLYVRKKLRKGWSPETIAGRLSLDHPDQSICPETIYQYIYNRKKSNREKLWKHLKLHRKKRMKKHGRKVRKEKIPNAVRINLRPKEAEKRNRAGHWETDNMGGKAKDKQAFSVTVERKTRVTIIDLLSDRTAVTKADAIIDRLTQYPQDFKQTLTADNGAENSQHEAITKNLKLPVYFCNPYHSWEKGSVENMIGRIRHYIPKGTSIDTITEEQAKTVEHILNTTPRKCLGFLTPYEKMEQELSKLPAP